MRPPPQQEHPMKTTFAIDSTSPTQNSAARNGDLDIGTISYWGITLSLFFFIGSVLLPVREAVHSLFFASGIGCLALTALLICISAWRRECAERERSLASDKVSDIR